MLLNPTVEQTVKSNLQKVSLFTFRLRTAAHKVNDSKKVSMIPLIDEHLFTMNIRFIFDGKKGSENPFLSRKNPFKNLYGKVLQTYITAVCYSALYQKHFCLILFKL